MGLEQSHVQPSRSGPDNANTQSFSRRRVLAAGLAATGGATLASLVHAQDAAATTITGYYNVKDPPYEATGDGETDDSEAIQSALDDAGEAGGGVVYLPPGEYRVDGSVAFLTVPDGVRVIGAGMRATKVKGPEEWNGQAYIFESTGARTEYLDFTIEMPDEFVEEGTKYLRGIQLAEAAEGCKVERVYFHNLTYAFVGWKGTTQTMECIDCLFTGEGVVDEYDAMGILYDGAPGAEVIVRGCEFRKMGSLRAEGINHVHCLYLSNTTALLIEGSRFFEHEEGRYVQFFGGSYEELGNAAYAVVDGCTFGEQSTPNTGIHTCPTTQTVISNCHFATQRKSITIKGSCVISNCVFMGGDSGEYWQIEHAQSLGKDAVVLIDNCKFVSNNYADIYMNGEKSIELVLSNVRFAGASAAT